MRLDEVGRFAWGALWGHPLRSCLSLLGVSVGLAAVVVLTGLGEGARRYVLDQFAQIGSNLLIVVPGRTETRGALPGVGGIPKDLTLADVAALERAIPEARRNAPFVIATATVSHGVRRRQVPVLGTNALWIEIRRLRVAKGQGLPARGAAEDAPVAVLGHKVAEELFRDQEPVGQPVRIGGRRLRVIGVLAPRGRQLGLDVDDLVLIPVRPAMEMFHRTSLFRLVLDLPPGSDGDRVAGEVRALLAERHGEEDVTLLTEQAVVASLSGILRALTFAVAGIAAISLVVAGIGILNLLLVGVSERTGEIGLLRALGASRRQVLACFLTEAILLAGLGGGLGITVGVFLARLFQEIFPALPAAPPAWALTSAAAVALSVGALFGYLPARRAAALDPVEALRSGE